MRGRSDAFHDALAISCVLLAGLMVYSLQMGETAVSSGGLAFPLVFFGTALYLICCRTGALATPIFSFAVVFCALAASACAVFLPGEKVFALTRGYWDGGTLPLLCSFALFSEAQNIEDDEAALRVRSFLVLVFSPVLALRCDVQGLLEFHLLTFFLSVAKKTGLVFRLALVQLIALAVCVMIIFGDSDLAARALSSFPIRVGQTRLAGSGAVETIRGQGRFMSAFGTPGAVAAFLLSCLIVISFSADKGNMALMACAVAVLCAAAAGSALGYGGFRIAFLPESPASLAVLSLFLARMSNAQCAAQARQDEDADAPARWGLGFAGR